MSKALLISVKPEQALNILNGRKILLENKRVPKGFKGWVYGYVTKAKPYLYFDVDEYKTSFIHTIDRYYENEGWNYYYYLEKNDIINGTIPFRFWFDEYEQMTFKEKGNDWVFGYFIDDEILRKLCISDDDVYNYGKGKDLYAWHIKKLDIFDKPTQLSEFYKDGFEQCEYSPFDYDNDLETCLDTFRIKRAPQSYQYVYIKSRV